MIGIVGYGGYVPRLRLSRRAVADANAWYAPPFAGKTNGTRAMANWVCAISIVGLQGT